MMQSSSTEEKRRRDFTPEVREMRERERILSIYHPATRSFFTRVQEEYHGRALSHYRHSRVGRFCAF